MALLPAATHGQVAVNSQVTDAVTQTNVKLLGEAPDDGMASLYQAAAASTGLAARNATMSPAALDALDHATTTQAVMTVFAVDNAGAGSAACRPYLTAGLAFGCLARAALQAVGT